MSVEGMQCCVGNLDDCTYPNCEDGKAVTKDNNVSDGKRFFISHDPKCEPEYLIFDRSKEKGLGICGCATKADAEFTCNALNAQEPTPSPNELVVAKKYDGLVCRGSWALGTACGKCERCKDTRPPALSSDTVSISREDAIKIRATFGLLNIDEYSDYMQDLIDYSLKELQRALGDKP